MRQLPLRSRHEVAGAVFVPRAGWEVPGTYSNLNAEVAAVRSSAGVIDLSDRVKVRLTGSDRVSFLNGLATQDVASLEPGRRAYTLFLNVKGKVVGDGYAYAMPDAYVLDLAPPDAPRVLDHIRKHLVSDDVEITDSPAAHLAVHGPSAPDIVRSLFGPVLAGVAVDRFATVPLDRKRSALIVGTDYLRVPGFGFLSWDGSLDDVWRGLLRHGAVPVGREAFTTLRIEAGRPAAGTDMDEETIALEARMEPAISFTKGCYEGQETIARATYQGHMNRLLVGLRVEGDSVPAKGDVVLVDGKKTGHVTSAAYSPTVRSVIALGYVRRPHDAPGTRVLVESAGWQLRAAVAPLPFDTGAP